MTDYIKREDALRMVKGVQYKGGLSVEKAFEMIPSADVVSVWHGKWEEDEDGYYCSICDVYQYGAFSDIFMGDYKYCPNCGAKMDGENK